jgi:hypothetical protein
MILVASLITDVPSLAAEELTEEAPHHRFSTGLHELVAPKRNTSEPANRRRTR